MKKKTRIYATTLWKWLVSGKAKYKEVNNCLCIEIDSILYLHCWLDHKKYYHLSRIEEV